MPTGRVIRSHGRIHYVHLSDTVLACRPRGRIRRDDQQVLVGDWVEVTPTGPGEGRIDRLRPRQTRLQRPPVANVDQVVVVFTLVAPAADYRFLDRVLVHAEQVGVRIVIALNKIDLVPGEAVAAFRRTYAEQVGYPVVAVSAVTGAGVAELAPLLAGRISVLAGNSGVGKSRLVQSLAPDRPAAVGELSPRLGRGRHTTRHVELIPLPGGGLVADAPGFTHLTFQDIDGRALAALFPEFRPPAAGCEYADCLHRAEPVCGVKAAVAAGAVPAHRHEHYLAFLAEIEAQRPWK